MQAYFDKLLLYINNQHSRTSDNKKTRSNSARDTIKKKIGAQSWCNEELTLLASTPQNGQAHSNNSSNDEFIRQTV